MSERPITTKSAATAPSDWPPPDRRAIDAARWLLTAPGRRPLVIAAQVLGLVCLSLASALAVRGLIPLDEVGLDLVPLVVAAGGLATCALFCLLALVSAARNEVAMRSVAARSDSPLAPGALGALLGGEMARYREDLANALRAAGIDPATVTEPNAWAPVAPSIAAAAIARGISAQQIAARWSAGRRGRALLESPR